MTYLVTGANRGIGLGFVQHLIARGDEVIATARRPEEATALNELAAQSSGTLRVLPLTVDDPTSCQALADAVGEETIDVLINNAGMLIRDPVLGELDYELIAKTFEVNSIGPLRITERLLPALRRGNARKVINITSQMGSIADNGRGRAYSYRASKAALNMINKSLANDLADENFICLVVHPGWVQTDMGGPNASIDVDTSITGMLKIVDTATPEISGTFWSWNGSELPW